MCVMRKMERGDTVEMWASNQKVRELGQNMLLMNIMHGTSPIFIRKKNEYTIHSKGDSHAK